MPAPNPLQILVPGQGESSAGTTSSFLNSIRSTPKSSDFTGLVEKNAPASIVISDYKNGQLGRLTDFGTNKFFLQSITENKQERAQILETFGDSVILFFGERTRVYTLNGTILDANQKYFGQVDEVVFNWAAAFRLFYDEHLRGTMLAKSGKIAVLSVNGQVYIGYPLSLSMVTDSRNPMLAGFNMSWAVVKQLFLPPATVVGDNDALKAYLDDIGSLYSTKNSTVWDANKQQEEADLRRQIAESKSTIQTKTDLANVLIKKSELEALNEADINTLATLRDDIDKENTKLNGLQSQLYKLLGIS